MASSSSTNKRFCEDFNYGDIKRLRYAKGTQYQTANVKNLFDQYCQGKNAKVDNNSPNFKEALNSLIASFLLSIRKLTGELYSTSTFNGMYFSLARSLMDEYSVDVIQDPAFVGARNARKAMKGVIKKSGLGYVKHTDTILENDLQKIAIMDISTPVSLQLKSWFLIQFHFALRGCENSHEMTIDDILIKSSDGVEYIEIKDKITKNHRGESTEKSNEARMMATSNADCPVSIVKQYLEKLHPENPFLWQRPKKKFNPSSIVWYDNQRVGLNKVATFMKCLSKLVTLSKVYTNHCPRATAITILGSKFPDSDVASHSGHKSMSAMKIYKRTNDNTKTNMSNELSLSLTSYQQPSVNEQECSTSNPVIDTLPYQVDLDETANSHNACCISFGAGNFDNENFEFFFENEISKFENAANMDNFDEKILATTNKVDFEKNGNPTADVITTEKNEQAKASPQLAGFNNCKCYFSGCTFNIK